MYLCSVDTVRFEVTTEWDSASSSTSQCACHQKIYRHFPPRFTHYRDTISVNPLPRRMTMTILISTQWHCFFFPAMTSTDIVINRRNIPCDIPVTNRKDTCLGSEMYSSHHTQMEMHAIFYFLVRWPHAVFGRYNNCVCFAAAENWS